MPYPCEFVLRVECSDVNCNCKLYYNYNLELLTSFFEMQYSQTVKEIAILNLQLRLQL